MRPQETLERIKALRQQRDDRARVLVEQKHAISTDAEIQRIEQKLDQLADGEAHVEWRPRIPRH